MAHSLFQIAWIFRGLFCSFLNIRWFKIHIAHSLFHSSWTVSGFSEPSGKFRDLIFTSHSHFSDSNSHGAFAMYISMTVLCFSALWQIPCFRIDMAPLLIDMTLSVWVFTLLFGKSEIQNSHGTVFIPHQLGCLSLFFCTLAISVFHNSFSLFVISHFLDFRMLFCALWLFLSFNFNMAHSLFYITWTVYDFSVLLGKFHDSEYMVHLLSFISLTTHLFLHITLTVWGFWCSSVNSMIKNSCCTFIIPHYLDCPRLFSLLENHVIQSKHGIFIIPQYLECRFFVLLSELYDSEFTWLIRDPTFLRLSEACLGSLENHSFIFPHYFNCLRYFAALWQIP